jgi:hypothetical protein
MLSLSDIHAASPVNLLSLDSVAILAPYDKSGPFLVDKAMKYFRMAAAKDLPEVPYLHNFVICSRNFK